MLVLVGTRRQGFDSGRRAFLLLLGQRFVLFLVRFDKNGVLHEFGFRPVPGAFVSIDRQVAGFVQMMIVGKGRLSLGETLRNHEPVGLHFLRSFIELVESSSKIEFGCLFFIGQIQSFDLSLFLVFVQGELKMPVRLIETG